ncbi:MAG: hypothetical protein EOM80_18585 [Erysipelotrichia bacterium]|nr:hypothetical protein [Erysipelotrichia bacterium]
MSQVLYRNKKTGGIYHVIGFVINATNAQDGQSMVLYDGNGMMFCREKSEFFEKFEAVDEPTSRSR